MFLFNSSKKTCFYLIIELLRDFVHCMKLSNFVFLSLIFVNNLKADIIMDIIMVTNIRARAQGQN
jgi:hypothetical protein